MDKRFQYIIKENLLTLAVGLAFSLVIALPESWINPVQKWWLALTAGAIVLLYFFAIAIKDYYQSYIQTRNEIEKELKNKEFEINQREKSLPQTFFIPEHSLKWKLLEDGTSQCTITRVIKNISPSKKNSITFVFTSSIYAESPKISEMTVGDIKIHDPQRLYTLLAETRSIVNPEEVVRLGAIKIPLTVLPDGGLLPNRDVRIRWKQETPLAFKELKNKEWVSMTVYYPSAKYTYELVPPNGYNISLLSADEKTRKSILVKSLITREIDDDEIRERGEPKIDENRLIWELENPKFGYEYITFFKCSKKIS